MACPIWHKASQMSLYLYFPSPSSLFFTLSESRALRRDLDSRNVFPFSHDAPGGDMAVSGPVREAVSASPMGGGGGADSRDVPLSLSVTQTGQATNGLFFQSFLAAVFFFVVLSSFHLFMLSLSSPFFPSSPLVYPSSFLSMHPPPPP